MNISIIYHLDVCLHTRWRHQTVPTMTPSPNTPARERGRWVHIENLPALQDNISRLATKTSVHPPKCLHMKHTTTTVEIIILQNHGTFPKFVIKIVYDDVTPDFAATLDNGFFPLTPAQVYIRVSSVERLFRTTWRSCTISQIISVYKTIRHPFRRWRHIPGSGILLDIIVIVHRGVTLKGILD